MAPTTSKQDNQVKKKVSGWDKAILETKKGISRLEAALSHFEDMKKKGQPWPGEQTRTPEHKEGKNSLA